MLRHKIAPLFKSLLEFLKSFSTGFIGAILKELLFFCKTEYKLFQFLLKETSKIVP